VEQPGSQALLDRARFTAVLREEDAATDRLLRDLKLI